MVSWEDLRITPSQVELLERSAITPEVAHQQGVRHIRNLRDLPPEFAKSTKLQEAGAAAFPGLLFRYHSPLTASVVPQYRPDTALQLVVKGKPKSVKYISAPGTPICPHVARLPSAASMVLVVEGTKQALAAVANTDPDVAVVGLSGCWNWQQNGAPHPQWKMVAGLPVVIAMDADSASNPEVYRAAKALGEACREFGASSVRYTRLKGEGTSDGLDDILGKLDEYTRPLALAGFIDAAEDTPADVDPGLRTLGGLRVVATPERAPFKPPPVVPNGQKPTRLQLPIPRAPEAQALPSSMSGQEIAGKILARCEADNLFLMVDSPRGRKYDPVYCYQEGAFRVLPETWLCQAIEAYDGEATMLAKKRAKESKTQIPSWEANETNISNVNARIRARLSAKYQMAPGESPLRHNKPISAVFANGTICWDEATQVMRWEQHNPWHRATWAFDFAYEPGLVPEHMLAVMRYSFADCDPVEQGKRVELLRAAAGIAFLGAYSKVRRAVWLAGCGNDGKGVFTNLVGGILKAAGATVTTVSPDDLGNRVMGPSSRLRLQGSRCNFAHEVSHLGDMSQFKSVLQCETGEGRDIGSGPVTTVADCAHFLDSNYPLPKVRVDNAWRRRIALVRFSNPIPANYPVDRNIDEKLLNTQTREFVCWAIDGALTVLANGGAFDLPQCHYEAMDEWAGTASTNNVWLFFSDAVEDTPEGTPKTKLRRMKDVYGTKDKKGGWANPSCYLAWHAANGYPQRDLVSFPDFSALIKTGAVPGVSAEVSHHIMVVRVGINVRVDNDATESNGPSGAGPSERVVPAPLDIANPFDRGHVSLFEDRPKSATEKYESRPFTPRRQANVIPLYEDDMTYDNEEPVDGSSSGADTF